MATPDGPVTELVEIPLCVPFEDFLSIFTRQLEPVLLAQPGIISILTGSGSKTTGSHGGTFAVSLTQWESMEAHAAFLQGPAAGPFFETVRNLASGPPTINHYYIGPLPPAALKSEYAWFRKDSASASHTQSQDSEELGGPGAVMLVGDCLEIESQSLSVSFGEVQRSRASSGVGKVEGSENSFTVVWRRRGTARMSHSL